MRVVFMGTPSFAATVLAALAGRHEVVAVYTRPDRPSGRGREPKPSPVKQLAETCGIPVSQPHGLREPDAASRLASLAPDVVCVAAYGAMLPKAVLDVPPLGCVNVHASLLPRWRGAAPVQRAILAGDRTTGVSIMRMEEGLDTGPYALQRTTDVDDLDAGELTVRLAESGAAALLEVLDGLAEGGVTWMPQDDAAATYAAKVTACDVRLSPDMPLEEALRRVRASGPGAPSRAVIAGKPVVIGHLSRLDGSGTSPGSIAVDRKGLLLGFADGGALVERLTPAGKREMSGMDFACGARIGMGAVWTGAS